jgi:hypothetical protein
MLWKFRELKCRNWGGERKEKKVIDVRRKVTKSLALPREVGGYQENSNDVKGGRLWPPKSSAHVA